MNILVIGPIPKEFGGKELGGVATHIFGFINEGIKNNLNISIWYHKQIGNQRNTSKNIEVIDNKLILLFKTIGCFYLLFSSKINFLDFKSRLILCYQYTCLKAHLKKKKIDIIHVHSLQNTSTLALKLLSGYFKIPIVITDHGFWQSDVSLNRLKLLKINSEYAQKVIYISDYAYEYNKKYNFYNSSKYVKIPNPIVFEKNQDLNKNATKDKIIFFNGLSESVKRKGFSEIINAINSNQFLCNNVKLVAIVNEAGEKYVKETEIKFKLELLKKLDWKGIVGVYKQSDIMVLPSKSESFGLVYIEALMFGLPIIGFNKVLEEFKGVFKENYIGESYDPVNDTPEDLAVLIERALSTPFDRLNIINMVDENYSWHHKINDFIELYTNCIKRKEFN